jgi:uncharacterized membrane protein HdeD (DUF308 family)
VPPGGREEPRTWRVALGIVMVLLGFAALGSATLTGIMSVVLIGMSLAVAGFVELLYGLGLRDRRVQPLRLMGGLLSVVVGALLVLRPLVGLAALTLLLAGYFLTSGLFHSATSLLERHAGWGWDFLYGVCAIVLSVITLSNIRGAGFRLVGVLVGIEILLRGLALAFGGFQRRRVTRSHAPTAA